jgi:hypothetical protein
MLHFIDTRQFRSAALTARHVDALEKRGRRLERNLGLIACAESGG